MTSNRDNRSGRGPRRQPGKGRDGGRDNRRGQDDRRGRDDRKHDDRRGDDGRGRSGDRRSIASVPTGGELPRWIRDEINRTTPKDRREAAITQLSRGVTDFADERFGAAYEQLKRAKDLAPQAATIRELLGLSAYHLERWDEALRELRTFRRISGEATQMPVELDCLRALGRPEDVEKTFRQLQEIDHYPEIDDEARVVFASSLLDRGLVSDAWKVIKPGRVVANPRPSMLRRWFVAARVAAAGGEMDAARRLVAGIADNEPDFPGLDELQAEIRPE